MTIAPNSDEARDIAYHLHSYTNARRHQSIGPLVIERGEGAYVYDNSGKRYLEGLSGLWSTALGFSEQRLVDAAIAQMRKLPYYHSFTHKSHGPVIAVAEKLISMAPVPMSKVFFTNSGSEANDTAMKLLWYRANALGKPDCKKIISRQRAYHGVTIASASLTGLPANHRSFDLPLANVHHVSCPDHYRNAIDGETEEEFATRLADELEETILREGPETVAAFIGEPVMGAGGVIVPPNTYWPKIQEVLNKYDILLVADEVICGFGRTGNMFGSQTFAMRPDIMVLSKQLTSTYFPFSAMLINDRVFEPIADESNRIGILGHGFTSGGHPVGAAVALENIKIIEERNLVGHVNEIGPHFQDGLRALADHPIVGQARGIGLIGALELVLDKTAKTAGDTPGQVGSAVVAALQANGVISRNLGDILAFSPPLIVNRKDIDFLLGALRTSLDEAHAALSA